MLDHSLVKLTLPRLGDLNGLLLQSDQEFRTGPHFCPIEAGNLNTANLLASTKLRFGLGGRKTGTISDATHKVSEWRVDESTMEVVRICGWLRLIDMVETGAMWEARTFPLSEELHVTPVRALNDWAGCVFVTCFF